MGLISVGKKTFIAGTIALALVSLTSYARSEGSGSLDADAVVLQLRGLPAELYTGSISHLCNAAPAKIRGTMPPSLLRCSLH